MKKPLIVRPAVQAKAATLPEAEWRECWLALARLCEEFGQPHLHSGLGIRKLRLHHFECRAGLTWRFIFHDAPEGLIVTFLGKHEDVRRLLQTGTFD